MKKTYKIKRGRKIVEKEYSYIPLRYVLAVFMTLFAIIAIVGTVVALCYFVPQMYFVAILIHVFCIVKIIASDDNPDYKVPWLFFVLTLPIIGFKGYASGYSFVRNSLTPWMETKTRILEEFSREKAEGKWKTKEEKAA